MPKNGLNVSLNSYDDIFSTEETRQEEQREQVQQIPIDELYPFKDHPFTEKPGTLPPICPKEKAGSTRACRKKSPST